MAAGAAVSPVKNWNGPTGRSRLPATSVAVVSTLNV